MTAEPKPLGPTFGSEVIAAGLGGLPFSWTDKGEITGRENLTTAQNELLDAVIAAHDPALAAHNAPAPPFSPKLNMGGTIAEVIGEE